MNVKLGCFGFVRHINAIAQAGYDIAELDICEVAAQDAAEFKNTQALARDSGMSFDVFSGFLPLGERICRDDFDSAKWLEHTRRAASRTAELGAKIWPFGSGKCRSIPTEGDPLLYKAKVAEFVSEVCAVLGQYSILLAIEPLGPMNSNYLNYIGEAVTFAEQLGRDNCKVMCDFRHMVKLGENFEEIVKYRDWLCHAHIDNPAGLERRFPMQGDGIDYDGYLSALERAGYDRILTVEATSYTNFEADAKEAMKLFRSKGIKSWGKG